MIVSSPAKLNLFLEVVQRREDGYHELDTLMVPVSVFDTLTITRRDDEKVSLRCRGNRDLPCDDRNLIVKAIELYRRSSGVTAGFDVILDKRIPVAAGLGGGSGNAAVTLAAIHRLCGEPFLSPFRREVRETTLTSVGRRSYREQIADTISCGLGRSESLEELGASLGSDVPFFLGDGAARCRGRGEILDEIPNSPQPFHFVLLRPPEGFATSTAYKYCRPANLCGDRRAIAPILAAWATGDPERLGRTCFNRLESAVFPRSAPVRETMELLRRERTCGVGMSGSGTCCFAICWDQADSERLAERLAERLENRDVASEERIGVSDIVSEERNSVWNVNGWFVCSVKTVGLKNGKK